MALKDRLRRFTRSDRSSSTSSNSNSPSTSLTHTPTAPLPSTTTTAPLQKSSSRLHLSKTFTAFSSHKKSSSKNKLERDPEAERRAIEEWRKRDEAEWRMPTARRPGRKSQKHQDVLRAFEFGFNGGGKRGSTDGNGRCGSVWSGVSPGTSRVGSVGVDDGGVVGRVLSAGSRRTGSVAVGRVEEE